MFRVMSPIRAVHLSQGRETESTQFALELDILKDWPMTSN